MKISLCIHPEGCQAWIDPVGVPFVSSRFIFFLGNTNNGGKKCPVGLKQLTIVTRDPVLRIEEKISDPCLSMLIFSYVCAV